MPWGDPDVTIERRQLDQAFQFNWGATSVRQQTQQINPFGILSRCILKLVYTSGALTIGAAGISVAPQAAAQRATFRALNQLLIQGQGVAAFYQLLRGGLDIMVLEYMGSGLRVFQDIGLGSLADSPTTTQAGALGRVAATTKLVMDAEASAVFGTAPAQTQNVAIAATYDLPISEWVKFPGYVRQTDKGVVTVPPQELEVGLVYAQSNAQNFTPTVLFNPLYGGQPAVDAPFVATGGMPSGAVPAISELWTHLYDVPNDVANQPGGRQFIVNRLSVDVGASGGTARYVFGQGGLLARVGYVFLDANDNIVDILAPTLGGIGAAPPTAGAPEPLISFLWGNGIYKYRAERASKLQTRNIEQFGEPPPPGVLVHDFFRDRTITDVINTAVLPSVRAEFTGLPASVATVHGVEERFLPVKRVGG